MLVQRRAVRGQAHSLGTRGASLQQRQIELMLQLAYGLGHGGLADEQQLRSPGKTLLFRNHKENTQQMQIHLHNYNSLMCEIYVFDSWYRALYIATSAAQ